MDIVDAFTCLGLEITYSLEWHQNTDSNITKAQQRLYFLRHVKSFKLILYFVFTVTLYYNTLLYLYIQRAFVT